MPRNRPRSPTAAPVAGGLKPLVTEEEERKRVNDFEGFYNPARAKIKEEEYTAAHEGKREEANEHWAKVRENCRHARDSNKTYVDFVVVLVTMFQNSIDMSKAIRASIAADLPKFAAYQDIRNLASEIRGWYKRNYSDRDPNEMGRGVERVIGNNLTLALDPNGGLDVSFKIRGREMDPVQNKEMREALDTLLMSYFQEEGFDFKIVPGKNNPSIVYSAAHPRCQAGHANSVAPDTPIERADLDALTANHCEGFKRFAQEIMDRPSPTGPVRGP